MVERPAMRLSLATAPLSISAAVATPTILGDTGRCGWPCFIEDASSAGGQTLAPVTGCG